MRHRRPGKDLRALEAPWELQPGPLLPFAESYRLSIKAGLGKRGPEYRYGDSNPSFRTEKLFAFCASELGCSVGPKKKPKKHAIDPLCTSTVSLDAIKAATGLAGTEAAWAPYAYSAASGTSAPQASEAARGVSQGQGVDTTIQPPVARRVNRYLASGRRGQLRRSWLRRAAEELAGVRGVLDGSRRHDQLQRWIRSTTGLDGYAPVGALNLGQGSKAFLMTGNLVAAEDAEEGTTFPKPGAQCPRFTPS